MGYSDDPHMVRVDFFKPSGKWYTTEAVKWTGDYKDSQTLLEFAQSLYDHLSVPGTRPGEMSGLRLGGLVAVCLEPYHVHACPLMLEVDRVAALVAERKK